MKRVLSSVKKLRAGIARSFPVTITLSAVLLSVTLNSRAAWFAKFDGVDGSASWAGDVNGDGRGDVGMIRAGAYMSGIQDASGNFTWTAPRSIGTTNVSGATIGHLLDPNRFALAVTAPELNRINIFDLTNPNGAPVSVFLSSIGPNVVVATDIGGVGNTAHEDFFITSILNSGAPNRFTTLRNTGGASFPEIQDEVMISFEHGNAVVLKLNDPQIVGVMERGGVTDTFRGLSFASGVMQNIISLGGLPRGSEFLYGNFGGTALSRFLFYRSGESNLQVSAVQEPVPGTFTFGALSTLQMGHALEFVAALPGAQPGEIRHKFFAIVDRSQLAHVYDFDGTNAPTVVQTFVPAAGEIFFGGIGIGNNDFMIFSRPAIGGQLTAGHKFAVHRHVNGAYVPGQTGALPLVSALGHAANVFEFRLEPFVNAVPNLLRSLNASDWSSLFMLNGNPAAVSVLSETFVDSSHGLDNPTPVALGTAHPQTQFGMVNQYTEFISISSFAPAIGDEISDVSIAPPSGLYDAAVAVAFNTANPAHQVFYRLNSGGNWTLFAGTPITIFTNTTVHYYGKPVVGNAKSTIRSASYQFRKSAGVIDSDGDGVPDFVEVGEGLDPLGGADSDGDGFSDFEELSEGTDPLDPNDPPSGSPGFEQKIGFDLVVTPRPLDGVFDVETNSQTGTQVRLYDINGSLLASAIVTNPPAAPIERAAVFHDVAIDPAQELLLVVTEPHFDIETAAADKRIGRELVGLVPVPQIAPITVDYVYGSAGGGLAAEADGWIAAAQQQSAGNEELYYTITLTRGDVASLFERKIQQLLADHGVESSTNVSLLPFRPTDAGWTNLAVWYEARATNASLKTYNLKNILATIEALVTNPPNAQIVAFNDYSADIYRLSSLSNNAAPGVYPLPVDSVRACIAVASGGNSPTSIGCQTMPPDAAAGVNFILASVNARPLTNINLRVRPGTFIGPCTTLETTGFMPAPVNLFDEDGGAFDLPDSFNLPPGSVIGITGHPDVVNTNCHGLNIEVVSLSLEAVPVVSDGDANGNLLIDSWEKLFLAMFGADPFGDHDGDGYSNLQEMFEGSDPTDGMGMPAVPPADLSPPQVEIEITPGGAIHLAWSWPAGYANNVVFAVYSTDNLGQPLSPVPMLPMNLGNGQFEATIPAPGTAAHFYVVTLALP